MFTGLRVGVQAAKTLAQVLRVPIVGLASLDVLAFALRHSRRWICSVIDARRGEVFFCVYRPVPGGVARASEFAVGTPGRLVAEGQHGIVRAGADNANVTVAVHRHQAHAAVDRRRARGGARSFRSPPVLGAAHYVGTVLRPAMGVLTVRRRAHP